MNKILNQREQLMHDIETILAGFDVDEQNELAQKLCDAVIKNFPTEHVQGENDDIMILSKTAYNKGFADAMSGHGFYRIYKDEKRHADYSHGFQMGIQEYES